MNKWRKEIINFFKPDITPRFICEDERVIKYTWVTHCGKFTSFVLKDINKVVVVNDNDEMFIRCIDFIYKYDGDKSWGDVWKDIGKCKFDYKSDDLVYLYNAIWVSMI